jgi:hypothetical protein
MLSVVNQVEDRDAQFARDVERLEARSRQRAASGGNGVDAGAVAGVDGGSVEMR